MKKLTIEEKIEISAALHGRVRFMKDTIAKLKNNGLPCIVLKSREQYKNNKICFRCSRRKTKPKTKNIILCPN